MISLAFEDISGETILKSLAPRQDDPERRLVTAAEGVIAGGVVSLNRKVTPRHVFCRGLGSKIWDIYGREFIDYHAAFSPHFLGHNYPAVNKAVRRAMDEQWSLMGSGPTPWEVRFAQLLCAAVPSMELLQLTNTGSEAISLAIRLSQAYTKREEIILMLGGYNGWSSEVVRTVMPTLQEIGPRVSYGEYAFLSASAGISKLITQNSHIVNFNDLESVEWVMQRHPIACVLTEPVLQNVGVIQPRDDYLHGLIDLCERYGAVCIFDEVKTGFRTALGGYQSVAKVRPHLSVFGKAVANGYPMAVVGGHTDIMNLFDAPSPDDRVLIAGTYNAHPLACAAGIATLEVLQDSQVYRSIQGIAASLYEGLGKLFGEKGIPAVVAHNGSAFCVYFCESLPHDWHDVLEHHDFELDKKYRVALIRKGIYHIPVPCKQGSLSLSHTSEDIAKTLEATREVLNEI